MNIKNRFTYSSFDSVLGVEISFEVRYAKNGTWEVDSDVNDELLDRHASLIAQEVADCIADFES